MPPDPEGYSQARTILAAHGQLRSQPPTDWCGTIPLPPDVATFYEQVGPVDITLRGHGNPTRVPSLSRLWDVQAGYRWNGNTGEPMGEWDDDWLVIATAGGDPYIFDRSARIVLFARHGEGAWQPVKRFPNLAVMASCLGTLCSIRKAAGDDFLNDDFDVRPEHRRAAIAAVRQFTGSIVAAEQVVDHVGWGAADSD